MLLVLLLIIAAVASHAQTLKITDVDTNNDRLWNDETKSLLGKSMSLTFFDRTVRVQIPGQKALVLKKNSENSYYISETHGTGSDTMSYTLTVETTVSVVTSATFSLTITENKGAYRSATLTIKGKRF